MTNFPDTVKCTLRKTDKCVIEDKQIDLFHISALKGTVSLGISDQKRGVISSCAATQDQTS